MYQLKSDDRGLLLHSWGVSCLVCEPQENKEYHARNDLLWKGILEELFEDFLRFFFPEADKRFDFNRGFEFLDKELEQIFPPEEDRFAPRHVDKLVKVHTREGHDVEILLHCEVQGSRQANFPERMFRYYARLWDKYPRPIAAIAILTDGNRRFRPACYEQSFLGTSLRYRFICYKVLDQPDAELEKSENPFAMVILTVKAALKAQKLGEKGLYRLKMELARRLHAKQIPNKKQRALMNFLRFYLRFRQDALNRKFENELTELTGRTNTMGIEELLLMQARLEGEATGEKRGEKRGERIGEKRKEQAFLRNLIKETDFDDRKIALLAGVAMDDVVAARREMNTA